MMLTTAQLVAIMPYAKVPEALTVHDEQMKLVVYRDIHRAEVIMETRLAEGNYYKFESVEAR